jgi:heterodisulfide reductase subunit A
VYIVHRDVRTYGLREELYRRARDKGIRFIRYVPEKGLTVTENEKGLGVQFLDFVLQQEMELHGDLVILASAIVPSEDNPMVQLFKVPVNSDGFFLEAHVKLRPVDFATDGVFVCGLAHAPKSLDESIAQAQAAAARAVIVLSQSSLQVGGVVSAINPIRCTGCQVCIAVCPYQAISLDEKGKAKVNEALCKGCGNCDAACRSGSPSLKGFADEAIFAQIEAC